jgi:hypothetical protein
MWKRASFWTKIKDTIQIIGTSTQLTLILNDSQHIYNVMVAVLQLAGLLLPVWFTDENRDGQVDFFEKEVTVKVTSDTPIQTEVKVEKKENPSHGFTEGSDMG